MATQKDSDIKSSSFETNNSSQFNATKETSNNFINNEKPEIRSLDARLTKPTPIETQIATVNGVGNNNNNNNTTGGVQNKFDQISVAMKSLASTGGKAIPLKGSFMKSAGELRVQVLNGSQNTSFGPLSKICCFNIFSPDNKIWENFVGNFENFFLNFAIIFY